jgi:Ca-activated chloride channel family protein
MGNYKDSKIEALAKRGNGNFAYLDDINEGEKILVKELTQTLYTVANDVFINIQFNPETVKEYRLIGYDNKKNILSDTASTLEGGEVGSGNGITAVFEIIPAEEKLIPDAFSKKDIASLKLNYRLPYDSSQKIDNYTCTDNYVELPSLCRDLKFATTLTMFGLLLRNSKYASFASWNQLQKMAKEFKSKDDYLQNEFISLVENAGKIYSKKGKKKSKTN